MQINEGPSAPDFGLQAGYISADNFEKDSSLPSIIQLEEPSQIKPERVEVPRQSTKSSSNSVFISTMGKAGKKSLRQQQQQAKLKKLYVKV